MEESDAAAPGRTSRRMSNGSKPHCFWRNARASTMKTRDEYDHMAVQVMRTRSLHLHHSSDARKFLHKILENNIYSIFMGIIILLNAVMVIHETDQKAAGDELPTFMKIASFIFLALYAIEIALRFYVHRMAFFKTGWNILDLMVVLADVFAELIKIWAENDLPSVSVLRIFRLARLLRLVAMLSAFQELQTMMLGFGSAIKGVVWASLMIGVVITFCSIIAVEFIHPLNVEVAESGVYGDCRRCGRAFETVLESNLTFVQQIIAGDSWGKVTIPIIEAYPATSVFFLLVFGFIDLGVLNLILTVIVNAAEAARDSNHEMQLRIKASKAEKLQRQLKGMVADLDVDHDGRISLEEFLMGVDENEDLRKTIALLDVQKQDCEIIYFLMDEDQSGDVDYNEFIHAMITWKNESLNTKLLFLKASIHDIYRDLKRESQTLNEQVVGRMMGTQDVAQAVDTALRESSAQMKLQPAELKAEFESLTQTLDQRWEQLHMEQAKSCKMLDMLVGEASLQPYGQRPWSSNDVPQVPREERGTARKSALSLLTLPPSCTHCEVQENDKPRIISGAHTPAYRAEPGDRLGRTSGN